MLQAQSAELLPKISPEDMVVIEFRICLAILHESSNTTCKLQVPLRAHIAMWLPCCNRYSSTTMVSFQLSFPVGYTPPSCAPDCLISLGCGEASLDPSLEGYSFQQVSKPCHPAQWQLPSHPLCENTSLLRDAAVRNPVNPALMPSCPSHVMAPLT